MRWDGGSRGAGGASLSIHETVYSVALTGRPKAFTARERLEAGRAGKLPIIPLQTRPSLNRMSNTVHWRRRSASEHPSIRRRAAMSKSDPLESLSLLDRRHSKGRKRTFDPGPRSALLACNMDGSQSETPKVADED